MDKLQTKFQKEIIPDFKKNFGYKNNLAVPKVTKVIVNVGIGRMMSEDSKSLEPIILDLSHITGQKPKVAKSTKAISGFKLRKGMPVGLVVTLRGKRMYNFMDKIINIVLPRIRDFRGVKPSALDQGFNLNLGIREQIVFPEIKPDQVVKTFGLQINFVTNAKNREEAESLFRQLGIIFQTKEKNG